MEKEMVFSRDEQVRRVWDRECVVQTINRHRYYYGNNERRRELSELWVRLPEHRETASLGFNNGFYVGMDEIARHYVADREDFLYEKLRPYCEADPGLEFSRRNLGLGVGGVFTCNTPLVYIADDGRSARFQGYGLNTVCYGRPDGTGECYMDFGLIRAELLKENGEWKIWHLVLEHDHTIEAGTDYGAVPVLREFGEDPIEREFGTPTVERPVHTPLFGWEHMFEDMPKPYYTYTGKDSYGPDGDLGRPYYERMRDFTHL